MTIPLLGFLTVTGMQVATSIRAAEDLDDFARQVALGREIHALVHELQRERDRTAGVIAATAAPEGGPAPLVTFADLAPDRTAVDRAIAAWTSAAAPLRRDADFDRAYRTAAESLAALPSVRDGVQAGWLRRPAVFHAYTRMVTALHALLLVPADVRGDAELAQAVLALTEASRAKELAAQIRGMLFAVCSATAFEPGESEAVQDVRAQHQAALDRFRDDADTVQLSYWDEAVSGQAVRNASRLEQAVLDNATADELDVDAQQWWHASTTQLELIRGAEQRLLDAAIAAADARSAQQRRSSQLTILGSLALLVVALVASLLIGRTMVKTLHTLRVQALEIAHRKLPDMIEQLRAAPSRSATMLVDPITVRSGDEVGEVAEAFTAVHRNAVRLAAEQALMRHNVNAIYVNLARRSQALVERQLQLLDALESSEADPDQLANLFRLDHLATRMRRNDDNLLVLAGGDTSRRWSAPVPLNAVVLAAAAEIEQYPRVRHDITDNVHIVGHAVADLVHLLAELLENATIFSPSDTPVSVLGWAGDDGATLVIDDDGLGMSPEALAQANRQVAAPVSIDVAAAERMGLVVVGHLAHRHGIRVQLRSQGRGVTVVVVIPRPLLAEPPAMALPAGGGAAEWLRGEPEAPALAAPTAEGTGSIQAVAHAQVQPRRVTPTRAEDVLGEGRPETSIWWSREPTTRRAAATLPRPRQVAPETEAGLPRRIPMAHLPSGPESTAAPAAAPVETDPQEAASVLSRFYGGVHRAAAEDEGEDLQAVK